MPAKKKSEDPDALRAQQEHPEDTRLPDSTGLPEDTGLPDDTPDLSELLAQMDSVRSDDPNDDDPNPNLEGPLFSSDTESIEPEDTEPPAPEKPKRASRKKKEPKADSAEQETPPIPQSPHTPARKRAAPVPILTIEAKSEIETEKEREAALWHDIQNANRTKRILTGIFSGIENSETSQTVAMLDHKGLRVIIPVKEMIFAKAPDLTRLEYEEYMVRQNKILNAMLGAEIDFVIRGIDSRTRSIVASRRDAMLKKRQLFYLNTDSTGAYRIYENRIVQARIIAVAEKVVRIEAFGVECAIFARNLSWDWVGDARERYHVGDQILVKIVNVRRNSLENISITVDARTITDKSGNDNLKKCKVQGKYAGRVVDISKGVVYIRLSNGANAVAHSCLDRRMPGKKDDVSFAVTTIDEERGYAVGIITRIIKQNL